jgi:hypothetical protein
MLTINLEESILKSTINANWDFPNGLSYYEPILARSDMRHKHVF